MTKQDYIALAEAIHSVQASMNASDATIAPRVFWDERSYQVIRNLASEIAGVLARDNSRFDRERFLAAALKGEWSNASGHANTRNGKR